MFLNIVTIEYQCLYSTEMPLDLLKLCFAWFNKYVYLLNILLQLRIIRENRNNETSKRTHSLTSSMHVYIFTGWSRGI